MQMRPGETAQKKAFLQAVFMAHVMLMNSLRA
jgi:hypothetical protein